MLQEYYSGARAGHADYRRRVQFCCEDIDAVAKRLQRHLALVLPPGVPSMEIANNGPLEAAGAQRLACFER